MRSGKSKYGANIVNELWESELFGKINGSCFVVFKKDSIKSMNAMTFKFLGNQIKSFDIVSIH